MIPHTATPIGRRRVDHHIWSTAIFLALTFPFGAFGERGACQELRTIAGTAADAKVDAFGDPIPSFALARLGTDRFRHPETIRGLAVSRNEEFVVTYGGFQVCIWRIQDGELLRTIELPFSSPHVTRIVLSPDDRFVAIVGGRREVCVHEVTSGDLAWKDSYCRSLVGSHLTFTYSSDEKFLVLVASNGVVVWGSKNATPSYTYRVPRIEGYDPSSHSVFHLNGARNVVWQTSLANGRRRTFSTRSGGERRAVETQFSNDGQWVVETWLHRYRVPVVDYGFDWKSDYEVRVIATSTGEAAQVWHHEEHYPRNILHRDQPYLLHVGERNAEFYDLSQQNPFVKPAYVAKRFGWIASNLGLLVYAQDQSVVFYDLKKQAVVPRASHDGQVATAHFSRDGRWLVTELGVWESRTSRLAWRFADPQCQILGFSGDSRHLLRTRDKRIYWHEVASDKLLREVQITAFVAPLGSLGLAFDYSPARELVAVADGDRVVIIDAKSGDTRLVSKRFRWPPKEAYFSPTGNYLVTAERRHDPYSSWPDEPPEIILWDLSRFESPKRLQFDSPELPQVQFDAADGLVLLFTPKSVVNTKSVLAYYEMGSGELVHRRVIDGEWLRRGAFLDSDTVALSPLAVKVTAEHNTLNEIRSTGEIRVEAPNGDAKWTRPIPGFRRADPVAKLLLTDDCLSRRAPFIVDTRTLFPALEWDTLDVDDERLAKLWSQLAGKPSESQMAIRDLKTADSRKVAEFLRGKLRPIAESDATAIRDALASLASDDDEASEKARQELLRHGMQAAPALRHALTEDINSLLQSRVEGMLREIADAAWSDVEELQILRALRVLEKNEFDDVKVLLRELASGAPSARLTRAAASILRLRELHAALPLVAEAKVTDP